MADARRTRGHSEVSPCLLRLVAGLVSSEDVSGGETVSRRFRAVAMRDVMPLKEAKHGHDETYSPCSCSLLWTAAHLDSLLFGLALDLYRLVGLDLTALGTILDASVLGKPFTR